MADSSLKIAPFGVELRSYAKISPYGTKVPYRWLIRIDTLLLRNKASGAFVDHSVDDMSPNTEDPHEGV